MPGPPMKAVTPPIVKRLSLNAERTRSLIERHIRVSSPKACRVLMARGQRAEGIWYASSKTHAPTGNPGELTARETVCSVRAHRRSSVLICSRWREPAGPRVSRAGLLGIGRMENYRTPYLSVMAGLDPAISG